MVNFELATQHDAEPDERQRLLHFVVVGGGPTGVEFSAEFYDFLKQVSSVYIGHDFADTSELHLQYSF